MTILSSYRAVERRHLEQRGHGPLDGDISIDMPAITRNHRPSLAKLDVTLRAAATQSRTRHTASCGGVFFRVGPRGRGDSAAAAPQLSSESATRFARSQLQRTSTWSPSHRSRSKASSVVQAPSAANASTRLRVRPGSRGLFRAADLPREIVHQVVVARVPSRLSPMERRAGGRSRSCAVVVNSVLFTRTLSPTTCSRLRPANGWGRSGSSCLLCGAWSCGPRAPPRRVRRAAIPSCRAAGELNVAPDLTEQAPSDPTLRTLPARPCAPSKRTTGATARARRRPSAVNIDVGPPQVVAPCGRWALPRRAVRRSVHDATSR